VPLTDIPPVNRRVTNPRKASLAGGSLDSLLKCFFHQFFA
jgi:hypothetical protein